MSALEDFTHRGEYSLVICEKPDTARRVADALKMQKLESKRVGNSEVFLVERETKRYIICSAAGHLYTVADTAKKRTVYPVYDVEWVPLHQAQKGKSYVAERIRVISELSKNASKFINSCDFDIEGETIGYNILKYACNGKESWALRAKFSTLTADELRYAIATAKVGLGGNLAEAGRTRHVIDFIYGINLSRALQQSIYAASKGFRSMSIGRVQGPTLSFVVGREVEIRTFVPLPYWSIDALVEKDGQKLTANYEKEKVFELKLAEKIVDDCIGKDGVVDEVKRSRFKESPPTPFNLGDLQREAYRCIGLTPSQTLALAERLYLDALISYPRTSSQKLPPSINYKKILQDLAEISAFRQHAMLTLAGKLVPHEGPKDDPAHPAIYPTGEHPKRQLEAKEFKLYALIVNRFLAVFAEAALRERISVIIDIAGYKFKLNGRTTISLGWLEFYSDYIMHEDRALPDFTEGERVKVLKVSMHDKLEQPPPRYNQSSLLAKMEEESIGTKATRSEIIRTLYDRGYITDSSIMATPIGFAVVETMQAYSSAILSVEMTREIEGSLENIEAGKIHGEQVIEKAIADLDESLSSMKSSEKEIGKRLSYAVKTAIAAEYVLGNCPVCKKGKLRIIKSKSTGKRFAGCTNYSNGCRASAPLPQKGIIKPLKKECNTCKWPIIVARFGRYRMKFCINVSCPTKKGAKNV
ncbi:MAG: DNA topoisomerase I [Thaumarchaeota archaeon]|nr:DNA topoisomerase I [Nitrososphaerota archaeon]